MSFITYLNQDNINLKDTINNKLTEISKALYSKGCAREKRPNGYYTILRSDANRKVRFLINTTNTNFCYEIATCDTEETVHMRENLLSVSTDEIVNEVIGYIT